MLRLPWDEWGETDVTLGMAAELHDQMLCPCGCGKWESEAHDPTVKDRVRVSAETCYVRQAIDEYTEKFKPGSDVLLSASILPEGHDAGRSDYEALRDRLGLPAPREAVAEGDAGGDHADGDERQ